MSEQKYAADDASKLVAPPPSHSSQGTDKHFTLVLYGHLAVVIVCAGLLLKQPGDSNETQADVGTHYFFFQHVSLMIFVGFGFLMTFLRRYSFSAVGLNLVLSCFVYLWNMCAAAFWEQIHSGETLHRLAISLPLMIEGLFGAGTVMITFGAVLGRTSPSQMVFVAFWEIVFYSFNFYLGALELEATDAGGSMFIHLFGALFGVALASQLTAPGAGKSGHVLNSSSYVSDITAMIGTIFLFIFWPSFNGGLTSGTGQLRAILNTTLSLAGSVLAAYGTSHMLSHRKFDMVHIQNATIAGGVAMGTAANLALNPAVSIFIGFLAGTVSVVGYVYVSPMLASRFNIMDTCGVLNLHGIPGLLGAVVGIIAVATLNEDSYKVSGSGIVRGTDRGTSDQTAYQVYTLLVTIGISIVGGLITGFLTKKLWRTPAWPHEAFNDSGTWEVPDDFNKGSVSAMSPTIVSPAKVVPSVQAV